MFRSVRARITATATGVFAIAFIVAAFGLVRVVDTQVHDAVRDATRTELQSVVRQIVNGGLNEIQFKLSQPLYLQVFDNKGALQFRNIEGTEPIVAFDGSNKQRELPGRSNYVRLRSPVYNSSGNLLYTVIVAKSLESADSTVATLRRSLFIATPLLILVVGLMVWTFVGRAFLPVANIREEVESIRSSTIDRRVPVPDTDDEVARLALMVNAMLDRLEAAQIRQREFVSDASHELRSPIASMRAELEVALAHPDQAEWPDVATRVLGERDRLERLVDDLFSLARIEEGQPLREVDVDLDDLVLTEAAHARPTPVHTAAVSAGRVTGDARLLEQVVRNLLDNATRYARSQVRVEVRTEDDSVVLRVDDDGPGVPEAERHRIFERFARADHGRGREAGGAGLGLALVDRVVAAHHGTITCDQAPLGGARFEVRLPALDPTE